MCLSVITWVVGKIGLQRAGKGLRGAVLRMLDGAENGMKSVICEIEGLL